MYVMTLDKINCGAKGTWGYGFNAFVTRMKMVMFQKPSDQIYAIDLNNGGRWFDMGVLTWKTGDLLEATPKPHAGKVGVLFLDGHALLEKVSKLKWTQATRDTPFYVTGDDGKSIGQVKYDK